MIKDEDLKRLINFSDAVVAVAITLLILPLTDLFQNFSNNNLLSVIESPSFISKLSNFLISFFVIYFLWETHRTIFSNVNEISNSVSRYNRVWLLSIIMIPAMTMITTKSNNNFGIYIYGFGLIVNILLLQIIKAKITANNNIFKNTTLLLIVIALILLTIFPKLGNSIFYLLLLRRPLNCFLSTFD
jgi:Predicted integral membrane protein